MQAASASHCFNAALEQARLDVVHEAQGLLFAQEAGEAMTIIGLVAAGCGISVLPASFDRIRMDGVCYRPIADPQATTSLLLAQREEETSPLVAAFVKLAEAAAMEGGA